MSLRIVYPQNRIRLAFSSLESRVPHIIINVPRLVVVAPVHINELAYERLAHPSKESASERENR